MFKRIMLKSNLKRSFQINIGLEEGFDSGIRHTLQEVLEVIGEWMSQRMSSGSSCLTGGTLVPGTMVYAWRLEDDRVKINQEDTVSFVGEVSPLYSADLAHDEVRDLLVNLASFVGDRLKQSRMYVMYMDEIIILQSEDVPHPSVKC